MDRKKIEQEQLCLQSKFAIDLLRTKLFQIESFSDYPYWDKKLKRLKQEIDSLYWDI